MSTETAYRELASLIAADLTPESERETLRRRKYSGWFPVALLVGSCAFVVAVS